MNIRFRIYVCLNLLGIKCLTRLQNNEFNYKFKHSFHVILNLLCHYILEEEAVLLYTHFLAVNTKRFGWTKSFLIYRSHSSLEYVLPQVCSLPCRFHSIFARVDYWNWTHAYKLNTNLRRRNSFYDVVIQFRRS